MRRSGTITNIALGGGGVKGIAYIGAFDVMERRGYIPGNLAGVSAGSLAGTLAAAGYDAAGMWHAMSRLDFGKIKVDRISDKFPVVGRFMSYVKDQKVTGKSNISDFFSSGSKPGNHEKKPGIFKNIVTYSKEGCLFDGDLLEQWIWETLAAKGIRSFGDLRFGKQDSVNPGGYKIRMTGIDCSRVKVVTLPDDLVFYGIDPDRFEVAKAIRISSAMPFAFKPVELAVNMRGRRKMINFIDGGILDPFPGWLLGNETRGMGYRLSAGENKIFSFDTPLGIIKGLISAVHDIGGASKSAAACFEHLSIGEIDTRKVGFLDFDLTAADKLYLYNEGKLSAERLLDSFGEKERASSMGNIPYGFQIGLKWHTRLRGQ